MNIIDKNPYQNKDGTISTWNRLQANMQYGGQWVAELQAQREATIQLERTLDHRFTLLRNIPLPGAGVPVPMLLVGPTGLWLLYASGIRGVFRAKDDSWMEMSGGRFRPAKPNMIQRVDLMKRALETHLRKAGLNLPEIKPVLVFTNPGQHVDSVHPLVRIVLSDAMDRFVANVLQDPPELTQPQAQKILALLTPRSEAPAERQVQVTEDERDAFSLLEDDEDDQPVSPARQPRQPGRELHLPPALERGFNLSGKQWALLAVIFGAWLLILIGFMLYLLFFM